MDPLRAALTVLIQEVNQSRTSRRMEVTAGSLRLVGNLVDVEHYRAAFPKLFDTAVVETPMVLLRHVTVNGEIRVGFWLMPVTAVEGFTLLDPPS